MNPNFASFIRVLANVQSFEDVQRDMSVTAFLTTKYSVTLSNKTFHYLMRYLQQQQVIRFKFDYFYVNIIIIVAFFQTQNQPPVLLHVLHAKVDVRLLDPLGAPSSKFEAVQRVLTEQSYSSDSSSSPTSSSQASMRFKTLDKTPVKLSVSLSLLKFPIKVSIVFHNLKFFFFRTMLTVTYQVQAV